MRGRRGLTVLLVLLALTLGCQNVLSSEGETTPTATPEPTATPLPEPGLPPTPRAPLESGSFGKDSDSDRRAGRHVRGDRHAGRVWTKRNVDRYPDCYVHAGKSTHPGSRFDQYAPRAGGSAHADSQPDRDTEGSARLH